MSDVPQGEDWWAASDGRWYPPEWHPGHGPRPRPRRTLAGDLASLWRWYRSKATALQAMIGLGIVVLAAAAADAFNDDEPSSVETTGTSTTAGPVATEPAATTTTVALPAGDDATVTTVIDGDSFAIDDGTRIRLIGVNTPEVETNECFSAEATVRQRDLIGPGTRVRLVYDQERTDRFGRTLAYVYRLSDGLFVNVALARDGFAHEQTVAPNTRHADQFRQAVADARTANRGLWSACAAATTAAAGSTVTTSAPSTTRPVVAAPTTTAGPRATTATTTGTCHPSYAGACIPIASDVDCAPGPGNGPAYTYANNFQVVGPDEYGLDGNDNDGIACET